MEQLGRVRAEEKQAIAAADDSRVGMEREEAEVTVDEFTIRDACILMFEVLSIVVGIDA